MSRASARKITFAIVLATSTLPLCAQVNTTSYADAIVQKVSALAFVILDAKALTNPCAKPVFVRCYSAEITPYARVSRCAILELFYVVC
jgi:hypothetical protein